MTIISPNQILERSLSLNDIWNKIRQHYGFHTTGAHFLDLASVRLKAGERPEELYQRLVSFIDDSLLVKDSSVTHHNAAVTVLVTISKPTKHGSENFFSFIVTLL